MTGRIGLFVLSENGGSLAELRAELRDALRLLGDVPDEPTDPTGELPTGHIETKLDDQGRIITPEGTPPSGLNDAIKRYFPREVWTDAARISRYESSWKFDATNDTRWRANGECNQRYYYSDEVGWAQTEFSVGYFQINICAHGQDREHWENADNNTRKASELYRARGNRWTDWLYTARKLELLED